MYSSTHRLALVVFLLLALLLFAACQRERPAAQEDGWTTPAAETATTPDALPGPATTVVVAGTPAPAGEVAPGGFVTGTLATPVAAVVLATPTPAPAIVEVGATFGYVVKPLDTLFSIALAYDTDVETIRRLNNLPDDTIQVGQVLIVPGTGEVTTQPGEEGATPAAEATPDAQVTYTVQAGDNLSSIATEFNISWQDIAAANNIPAPYTIYRGQRLVLPGVEATPEPTAAVRKHIVQPGETMFGIAVQYGVTVQTIMQANNLTDPNYLRVGQELIIPE